MIILDNDDDAFHFPCPDIAREHYATTVPSYVYRDLRSARREQNRIRKHMKKYGKFRGITRADLPSSSSQKSHYLPVCRDESCSTFGTNDDCFLQSFPADLSTAPVAKFTKKEAYDTAQWDKPPRKHRSDRYELWNNGHRQWVEKRNNTRYLLSREWYDDVWGWYGLNELDEDCDFVCPACPIDDHIDWEFQEGHKVYGGQWDEYDKPKPNLSNEDPKWHRRVGGGWLRSWQDCEEDKCECVKEWDEPVKWQQLDNWYFPTDARTLYWEKLADGRLDSREEVASTNGEVESEVDDWDLVSNASTESWSELEEFDDTYI